jgi:DNA-directed RNA polymerase specialized sigma24 family protein
VKLPPTVSEDQVVQAINKVVAILAPSFVFGCYGLDDIKQEGRVFGLQAMAKYDPSRPLENFLYSHIRNRLINLRRDKYHRNDPPCKLCQEAVANRTAHPDGRYCAKFLAWRKRNAAKANLMRPLDLEHVSDETEKNARRESDVVEGAEVREALKLIDEGLPVELRATYLQMRAGQAVSKARKEQVVHAIRSLLRADHDEEEE